MAAWPEDIFIRRFARFCLILFLSVCGDWQYRLPCHVHTAPSITIRDAMLEAIWMMVYDDLCGGCIHALPCQSCDKWSLLLPAAPTPTRYPIEHTSILVVLVFSIHIYKHTYKANWALMHSSYMLLHLSSCQHLWNWNHNAANEYMIPVLCLLIGILCSSVRQISWCLPMCRSTQNPCICCDLTATYRELYCIVSYRS